MNHSMKSADGGTHIKIVAVSLTAASLWMGAMSAMRLHDIGLSEIVAKPAIKIAVKSSPPVRMAEAVTFVGWTSDVWRPAATVQQQ